MEKKTIEQLRKEKSELIRKYKSGLSLFADSFTPEQKAFHRKNTCAKLADILISIAEIDVDELS